MPRRKRPVLGVDYVIDANGRAQYTRQYLVNMGYCCEHACRYCPYVTDEPQVDVDRRSDQTCPPPLATTQI